LSYNLAGGTGILKFGSVTVGGLPIVSSELFPATIFMGIVGGCLGSFFININTRMGPIRKRFLTQKWMKPVETLVFSFVTASCFYWIVFSFRNACVPMTGT